MLEVNQLLKEYEENLDLPNGLGALVDLFPRKNAVGCKQLENVHRCEDERGVFAPFILGSRFFARAFAQKCIRRMRAYRLAQSSFYFEKHIFHLFFIT